MGEQEHDLDELIREFYFVQEAVERGTERMRRGKSMPDVVYKTVMVLTLAYLSTMKENFPGEMAEEMDQLKDDLRSFRKMYSAQRKKDVRRYAAAQEGNRPSLKLVLGGCDRG